jgi:hypothetical protein
MKKILLITIFILGLTGCNLQSNVNNITKNIMLGAGSADMSDDFESGGLANWSSSTTDGGNLSATTTAKLHGSYGLNALINDTNSLYVENDLSSSIKRFRARFYFNVNSLTIEQYQSIFIFNVFNSSWGNSYSIRLSDNSTNKTGYEIYTSYWNDADAESDSSGIAISNGLHYIEIDFTTSSAAGANNGAITTWIDGTQVYSATSIDNDTKNINYIQLGPQFWWGGAFSGNLYFDDFVSNSTGTAIGAVTSSSGSSQTSDLIIFE